MADSAVSLHSDGGPDDRPDAGPDPGSNTGAPRWVMAFAIIAVVLVLLAVVLLLVVGGDHGPGRHTGSGEAGGQTLPTGGRLQSGVGGHASPASGHTP